MMHGLNERQRVQEASVPRSVSPPQHTAVWALCAQAWRAPRDCQPGVQTSSQTFALHLPRMQRAQALPSGAPSRCEGEHTARGQPAATLFVGTRRYLKSGCLWKHRIRRPSVVWSLASHLRCHTRVRQLRRQGLVAEEQKQSSVFWLPSGSSPTTGCIRYLRIPTPVDHAQLTCGILIRWGDADHRVRFQEPLEACTGEQRVRYPAGLSA